MLSSQRTDNLFTVVLIAAAAYAVLDGDFQVALVLVTLARIIERG